MTSETFTCDLSIPGRKRPLTFTRPADGRSDQWYAVGANGGRQGFGLTAANERGLMRVYPITGRRGGMPGAPLPVWVREVVTGGSPRLEVA